MSDASSFDDVEGTPDLVPRAHIRDLEAKARRTDELEAQLAQVTKDAAFTQALGPSTDPRLDYFRRGYQGDVNPEAIRQAATAAGFLAAESQPAADAQNNASAQDLSAHARMADASAGADAAGAPAGLSEAIAAAQSPEEVMNLIHSEAGQRAGLRTTHQNQ
jgi:hypothetical protein